MTFAGAMRMAARQAWQGWRNGEFGVLLAALFVAVLARQVAQALAQPDLAQQLARGLAAGLAAQFQRQRHVVERAHRRHQLEILEHEAHRLGAQCGARVFVRGMDRRAVQPDLAAAGHVQAGQQREQGGLAGTGLADDRDPFAGGDVQADAVEDGQLTVR